MTIYETLDQLVVHFTNPPYDKEVALAKSDFFDQVGAGDDSHQFELRMSQFLDWYLFSRDLSTVQVKPIELILEEPPDWASDEFLNFCKSLKNIRHSLFEFIKIRGHDVYLKDLLSGKKIVIRNSRVTVGFSKDEIFEARLIPVDGDFVFSGGFCFHPLEAGKFVLKEIKKIRNLDVSEHEALMMKLLKMRYKHEQYAHIRIDYIYTNDAKLRI